MAKQIFQLNPNAGLRLNPSQCPRFEQCSAPICPLDEQIFKRTHVKGEPVCFYLRQHAKDPLWGRKAGDVPAQLVAQVSALYPQIVERYAPLKSALVRAATSPVKGFAKGGVE